MLGGTALNYALMGTARGGATVMSNPDDVASSIVHRLAPTAGVMSTPRGVGRRLHPLPGVEVSEADVFAALDGGVDVEDIALGDVAPAYLGLRSHVAPEEDGGGGNGAGTEIVPLYTFIGAASDSSPPSRHGHRRAPGPDGPRPVRDGGRRGAHPGDLREPSYRDGARRLRTAPQRRDRPRRGPRSRPRPLPVHVPERAAPAAAVAALEREGVTGDELARAQAALSR